MTCRTLLTITVSLLAATGCVHGQQTLYGAYEAQDMGLNAFTPPVTLALYKTHRYRFCVGRTCSTGHWSVLAQDRDGHGRMTLVGPELEKWLRDFNAAANHSDDPKWLDTLDGSTDVDYDVGLSKTSITLGAGDAAFVKE